MRIAYVCDDRIMCLDLTTLAQQEINCQFALDLATKHEQLQHQRSWRHQSNQNSLHSNGYTLWSGNTGTRVSNNRASISSVVFTPESNSLYYSFQGEDFTGLFNFNISNSQEKRIFHSPNKQITSLAHSRHDKKIIYSVVEKNGTENLYLRDLMTNTSIQLTEGDSYDRGACWSPDQRFVYYQSAGIGHDESGAAVSRTPFSLFRYDLEKKHTGEFFSLSGHDLVHARISRDGHSIFCLKRAYRENDYRTFLKTAIQLAFLPFRFVQALFEFLNNFAAKYTGKPLLETKAFRERADLQYLLLSGDLLDLEDDEIFEKETAKERENPIPLSKYDLVQIDVHTKKLRTLTHNVISYDISPEDSSFLFTDGTGIFHATPDFKEKNSIHHDNKIQTVLWC